MDNNDLPTTLPLQSLEEAIPLLRRPYLSSQVYGKVQNTPKNEAEPCTIALYGIKDTLYDRLNLLCGREWTRKPEVKKEAKLPSSRNRELFYCEVEVRLTVFGKADSDIGDGFASTRAGAEMTALAQAFKRVGSHFGLGLCLTSCDEVMMIRGGEGEDRLCIPEKGDEPWMHPYFDLEGRGRRYVRSRYKAWLDEYGKDLYGEPLDHLALARVLANSPRVTSVAIPVDVPDLSRPKQPAATAMPALVAAPAGLSPSAPEQNGRGRSAAPADRPAEAGTGVAQAKDYLPMPDHPAPISAIRAAAAHGYGQEAARILCNIVRGDGQDEHVSRPQLVTVENWLKMLDSLSVPEDALLAAAAHNANRRTTQERRQALFSRWLGRKASGEQPKAKEVEGEPKAAAPGNPSGQPASEPAGTAEPEKEDPVELARAITDLQSRMGDLDFDERTVVRLAALALGRSPNARVRMSELGTAMVRTLTDLLDCAGALGWNSERLDGELLEAHGSDHHATFSGRFAAFANNLKDLAESRRGRET